MASIELKGVGKTYGDGREIINGLDLTIESGEFMVFVGPSGCGKSTLLRMIAGLETISFGDILVDSIKVNNIPPSERGGAMVFQNYALYPQMNVARNLGFALEVSGKSKREIESSVKWAAEILNISHLLKMYPKALSGGERQRVAIGRAIVRKPKFFLFDEPLSNLDASLRLQLRIELVKLHQEFKTTMVYVTHDQVEAMTMGNRIALFRKGKLEQANDPVTMYLKPKNTFVAEFLGSPAINILDCSIKQPNQLILENTLTLNLSMTTSISNKNIVKIGIRPEDFSVANKEGLLGKIILIEYLGDQTIVHVKLNGFSKLITAKLQTNKHKIEIGQSISLQPDFEKAIFFNNSGNLVN